MIVIVTATVTATATVATAIMMTSVVGVLMTLIAHSLAMSLDLSTIFDLT